MKIQLAALLAVLSVSGVARADEATREARLKQIHGIAIQVLEKRVQLDEATAVKVQAVVEQYREPMREARRERRRALRELRLLLRNEKPSERRIKKLEAEVVAAGAKLARVETDRLAALGRVTTPAQLGKLMVSWKALNREIHRERIKAIQS